MQWSVFTKIPNFHTEYESVGCMSALVNTLRQLKLHSDTNFCIGNFIKNQVWLCRHPSLVERLVKKKLTPKSR